LNIAEVTRSEVCYLGLNRMSNIHVPADLASLGSSGLVLVRREVSTLSLRMMDWASGGNVFLARDPLRPDAINTCIPQLEARGVDVPR